MKVFKDPDREREFRFITNNFRLSALTIAKLYKKDGILSYSSNG
jgi:hypothetical protein